MRILVNLFCGSNFAPQIQVTKLKPAAYMFNQLKMTFYTDI